MIFPSLKYIHKYVWNKWYIVFPWMVFPFFILGIYLLVIYKNPFVITTSSQNLVHAFTDSIEGGSSECYIVGKKSGLKYRYILKDECDFPYAGIWYMADTNSWFDLYDYEYVKVKLKAESGNWVIISLASHIPEFSVNNVISTHKYLNHLIPVSKETKEIIIPVKDFTTPLWWYKLNNKKEADFAEADLSKVKYIAFIHPHENNIGIENNVEILEAGFYTDWMKFIYKCALGLFSYYTISCLIFIFFKRKPSKQLIHFSYEKVDSLNHKDREEAMIFEFVNENYRNSELTISDVQVATGISDRRISYIIKNKTQLNFKQYLNLIRISEAKKLLCETNLPISEIAIINGYGSASHFNRVFKNTEDCSPNDFRKRHSTIPATSA